VIDAVDPFIGTDVTDLPPPHGLAATWWWPKPQVGNTHPGATSPLGMVSACAYSGAYPTGYGVHELSTEGVPTALFERLGASGFTHFQQSGTGAIRKYYNYLRVTPMVDPLDDLGTHWTLHDEDAEPGYYTATLSNGIRCELTVGPKSTVHRYTFPAHSDARSGRRLLTRWAGDRARPDRADAGAPGRARNRASPTARSWSRARRSPSTSSATRRHGARCSGTTSA
jgi:hypothetical protein